MNQYITKATNCRIHSLKHSYPLYHQVPKMGNGLVLMTDVDALCPGRCAYCTNGLKAHGKTSNMRKTLSDDRNDMLIKLLNNMKDLNTAFLMDSADVAFYPHARQRAQLLCENLRKDILRVITTKNIMWTMQHFNGYKNLLVLVSLTNPFNISGLENNKVIPTWNQRMEDIVTAYDKKVSFDTGIRFVVMQKRDIRMVSDAIEFFTSNGIVKPEHCLVGALRSGFHKGEESIQKSMNGFIDPNQFESDKKYRGQESLRENILLEMVYKLKRFGVSFDRLPDRVRKKVENDPQVNLCKYPERRKCYLIPPITCIAKASDRDHLVCGGMYFNKETQNMEVCPAVRDASTKDFLFGRTRWGDILRYGWFARGERFSAKLKKEAQRPCNVLFVKESIRRGLDPQYKVAGYDVSEWPPIKPRKKGGDN